VVARKWQVQGLVDPNAPAGGHVIVSRLNRIWKTPSFVLA
jgi:hypothetical protein